MKISVLQKNQICEKRTQFDAALFEESRFTILGKAVQSLCTGVFALKSRSELLKEAYEFLLSGYGRISGYFPWQVEQSARDDTRKLSRFLRWIGDVNKKKFLGANISVQFIDGNTELFDYVHLVWENLADHSVHAVITHPGVSSRSMKGRNIRSDAKKDLQAMVAKYYLEEMYPGITIHVVYISLKDDEPEKVVSDFIVSGTANTNVHSLDYAEFYDDNGIFDKGRMESEIRRVVSFKEEEGNGCKDCKYRPICKMRTLSDVSKMWESEKEHGTYQPPDFTDSQKKVVSHKNGALLVCAGAGSGKTASLVGRVEDLIRGGAAPSTILLLAFSKKAAEEIRGRLSVICKDDSPTVCTIHSLAFKFLHGYGESFFGKKPALLDDGAQLELIKNLVSCFPRIEGFNYEVKDGKYGLYNRIRLKLKEYLDNGDGAFRDHNMGIGEGFYALAEMYQNVIKAENYISFDDMIPLATQLLQANPDILELYQNVYRYIMVDEFQDVNEAQYKFIDLLAQSHKNIMVVGDDDQSIYQWRGGDNRFLLNFSEKYNCETVVLAENFRSSKAIVDAANHVISNNKNRIPKNVCSRSGKSGTIPYVVDSLESRQFDQMIEFFLRKGYRYEDIAIIARENSTLEELSETLKAPCALAKSYLIQDGLFIFAFNVLKLYKDNFNKEALLYFMGLYGLTDAVLSLMENNQKCNLWVMCEADASGRFDKPMNVLHQAFAFLDEKPGIDAYLEYCSILLLWTSSNAKSTLMDMMEESGKEDSLDGLLSLMQSAFNCEAKTRVDTEYGNCVTLITNHDAKGKEWPVVLLASQYKQKNDDSMEDIRKLFYVGVTRAKEQLCIFEEPNAPVSFLSELTYQKVTRR